MRGSSLKLMLLSQPRLLRAGASSALQAGPNRVPLEARRSLASIVPTQARHTERIAVVLIEVLKLVLLCLLVQNTRLRSVKPTVGTRKAVAGFAGREAPACSAEASTREAVPELILLDKYTQINPVDRRRRGRA